MTPRAEPVGGSLITPLTQLLAGLFGLAALTIAWRLVAGLGATTALNDGYPLGLWIAFDVVTGTALACGGYAVAVLVYVLNKGRYHPLIRPAVLTSALGYSLAGFGVFLDIGRWWAIWKVPVYFWHWNFNSALLEVALCIMTYVVVLWIELSPALLERFVDSQILPLVEHFRHSGVELIRLCSELDYDFISGCHDSLPKRAGPPSARKEDRQRRLARRTARKTREPYPHAGVTSSRVVGSFMTSRPPSRCIDPLASNESVMRFRLGFCATAASSCPRS